MNGFLRRPGWAGFYLLGGRGILVKEPGVEIRDVALGVPLSWRGEVFDYYLGRQGGWRGMPLYICDEWLAYTHGSMVRRDLGIKRRGETVDFMVEFTGYSLVLAKVVKEKCPGYDSVALKAFLKFNLVRVVGLGGDLKLIRESVDGAGVREFCRDYFGVGWCKEVMGF